MSRFVILMYHMISEPRTTTEKRYACPPQQFEKHIQMLLDNNYTPISIDQVWNYYSENIPLPDKAVLISLDDGFEDNYLNAFPVFKRYNIPAIIYLASGVIGHINTWMVAPAFSQRKMLSWEQIKEMSNEGIQFGSHTVTHSQLDKLSNDEAYQELIDSKQSIENHLGCECSHFAYPFGLFNEHTQKLVSDAGYKTACSTRSGFNNAERNPLILHRIDVYGTDSAWKLKQKLTYGINNSSLFYPMRYVYNRLIEKTKNLMG
ncbi:polysaccharide deacetylase family protein [Methylicorpusculum sp.]|uniref:polysaccharide deacetylase family protein n=1 Tax=Methylicorpusculum sp. TaxID=2713644 RepID=UPI00271F4A3E|nr:polysaccharide deacetylase family protein [Methylicorpusculum sp.]MDO9239513.1 polysaccharide deacetylase family protein [Methylicorpusculum sp.]MDP2177101.1 polysaccharide deacetylase family protein [Methylicorpusculum sp.]MDP3531243.1 polysaccharide deacetylase family protein [Methylicorpusculum sp.]